MRSGKTLIWAIAILLILSSLTAFSIGKENEPIGVRSDGPTAEPRAGAQRVVLMEEFTHWGCSQCTILKNYLAPAIDNYTYSQVAPLYYHTSIGINDPVFIYNGAENFARELYYGAGTNPWTEIDGIYKKSFDPIPDGPTINGWFDERLAIPANITISTTGSIDAANLTGTVEAHIEAVEDIVTTDLVVQFALWEDHIDVLDRFGSIGSNGETEFRWVMWDMVFNASGEAIWSSGADKWDSIDLVRNFTIEPEWNITELGVSIWVQSVGTRLVEQAAVEDFGNFADHSPTVEIFTPGAPDLILPGSYDITWTASDYEDADATLDVIVEYSPDGGFTWIVLENGVDNNDGIFTWDTTSLPDGPNYLVRVSVTDSTLQTTTTTMRQPSSIDNVMDDEWFLQVQMAGSNQDLDMKPMEKALNSLDTTISTPGQYKIGTWETTKTFVDAAIDGPWTFNVYGYARTSTVTGYLYARVFASTGPTLLDTTVNDDEDVGAHTSSHLFTWNDTLSGSFAGADKIIVELWLNVTANAPSIEQTINPDVDADPNGWTGLDWGVVNPLVDETWYSTGGNPTGWLSVEFTSDKFNPALGGFWEQAFTPSGTPSTASLSFDWTCSQYIGATTMDLYVFIDTTPGSPTVGSEVWGQTVTGTAPWTSQGPTDVLGIVNSPSTYYLKVAIWIDGAGSSTDCVGGFDNVQVTWETSFSAFVTEFDYGGSQSSIQPTLASTQTYAIGPLEVGWNLISTPLIPSDTSVPVVFIDLDADTNWTMLQSYDPMDAGDHWKAWTGFTPSVLNDLVLVDEKMGSWLFIPDAPSLGDGFIRVGGLEPASTVIDLKAGWNMAGYPAIDDSGYDVTQLMADTGATGVEGFNPAAPYRIEALSGNYVLKRGEAYWIKVDSDTTWTVDW